MTRKNTIKFGMIGWGPGSYIGGVHRQAAALAGDIELVAGAFSTSYDKSLSLGAELSLSKERLYKSFQEMIEKESKQSGDERLDFISIVTPNHLHYTIAKECLSFGFNVVCEKPMSIRIDEAEKLCRLTKEKDLVFAVTYNYTGYPMVKQARELVRSGFLGPVRKIVVAYSSGWLSRLLEVEGSDEYVWRIDPEKVGCSSCIADMGSHAENLSYYITGLKMVRICADLTPFISPHILDNDGNILVHYEGGARVILYSSQISVGDENDFCIRVYGTKASIEWRQEEPNFLHVRFPNQPEQLYKLGNSYLEPIVKHNKRLPAGHPEGYLEGFANVYRNVSQTIHARKTGEEPSQFNIDFPTVEDGARGVRFINKAVESGQLGKWVDMIQKSA